MPRTHKKLTVLFGATLLACVVLSSGASAAEFHSSVAPVTISGSQSTSMVLTTDSGTVICKSVTFTGSLTAKTSTEFSSVFTLKECTAFGFINVPVDWNGCEFKWTASGAAHIVCKSKPIELTAPGCTTFIGGQSLPGGATFTTSGSAPNRHITEHWNFSGLSYIDCGKNHTNGTWKGSFTTKTSSGEHWWQ